MIVSDQAGSHKYNSLNIHDNFFLELLPPYSPKLDHVEKLWHYLKTRPVVTDCSLISLASWF